VGRDCGGGGEVEGYGMGMGMGRRGKGEGERDGWKGTGGRGGERYGRGKIVVGG